MTETPKNPDGSQTAQEALLACVWTQFTNEFPTEEACIEELFKRASTEGLVDCRYCGNLDLEKKYGARVLNCRDCKKTTWFTAGTFFHGIRRVRAWLVAIRLREHGIVINATQLEELVGIAYDTAWNICNKLSAVIYDQMKEDFVAVPSAFFSVLFCRRSRETPARAHPVAEQAEVDKKLLDIVATSQCIREEDLDENQSDASALAREFPYLLDFRPKTMAATQIAQDTNEKSITDELSEQEKEVYNHLSANPTKLDDLCERTRMPVSELASALTMLELSGTVENVPGAGFIRRLPKQAGPIGRSWTDIQSLYGADITAKVRVTVSAAIDFIRGIFRGISRKYLQYYLASYWAHIDRTRWSAGLLLTTCLRVRPVSYAEISNYVSPVLVKILPYP